MRKTFQPVRAYLTTVNDGRTGAATKILTHYDTHMERRTSRARAITDGLREWGHDDFNIWVWEGDLLTSIDWMDDVVDVDPYLLAEISDAAREGKGR